MAVIRFKWCYIVQLDWVMTETRGPIRDLIVILLQCSDTITVYYRTTHRGRVTTVDTCHNISIIDFLVYLPTFVYLDISIHLFKMPIWIPHSLPQYLLHENAFHVSKCWTWNGISRPKCGLMFTDFIGHWHWQWIIPLPVCPPPAAAICICSQHIETMVLLDFMTI